MLGRLALLLVAAAVPLPAIGASHGCVDLNTADRAQLPAIIHIDEDRSAQIVRLRAQRPFRSVEEITRVRGIARGRLREILEQGLACVDGDTGAPR